MKIIITLIAALALVGSASAHIGFKDGPKSARLTEQVWEKRADIKEATCVYQTPHVKCWAMAKMGNEWSPIRATFHKTAPKKGFALICLVGIDFCVRKPMTYAY